MTKSTRIHVYLALYVTLLILNAVLPGGTTAGALQTEDLTPPIISIQYYGYNAIQDPGIWIVTVLDPESGLDEVQISVDGIIIFRDQSLGGILYDRYKVPVPSSVGVHTITVFVTNSDHASSSNTDVADIAPIIFDGEPHPVMTATPPVAYVGEEVSFSVIGFRDDPKFWIIPEEWNYGDGSSGEDSWHVYSYTGTFFVTVTKIYPDGFIDHASTHDVYIVPRPNTPPVAEAGPNVEGVVGAPVQFDGSGSSDPDGTIVAYAWDFGDGTTGTGVTPTHTYPSAGTYEVTLMVTDNGGLTATDTLTVTITPPAEGPLFSDALGILPLAILAGVLVVRRRRRRPNH